VVELVQETVTVPQSVNDYYYYASREESTVCITILKVIPPCRSPYEKLTTVGGDSLICLHSLITAVGCYAYHSPLKLQP